MNEARINVEAIEKLCLEINEYSEKVKNTLTQVNDTFDEMEPYFNGDCSLEWKNKFYCLKDSFENVYTNISSYIDDFNILISSYGNFDIEISNKVNANTENIKWKEVR